MIFIIAEPVVEGGRVVVLETGKVVVAVGVWVVLAVMVVTEVEFVPVVMAVVVLVDGAGEITELLGETVD